MKIELTKLPPNPLVSIIVPSYNQGKFIKQTIDSILEQNYRPLEVIIVDGASKDETIDVLYQYNNVPEINWTSEEDTGVVEAVNKGFKRSKGLIGAIQSSDDFYLPGAVRKSVDVYFSDSNLGILFGDIIKIDSAGNEIFRTNFGSFSIENFLSSQIWIPQPSTFFRMDLAKDLGGWRNAVSYAADTDLWLRMMLCSKVRKVDRVLATRRMHKNQRDKLGKKIMRDYTHAINDFFNLFNAPNNLFEAAQAGMLLKKNRYYYNESKEVKIKRIRKATLIYPPLKSFLSPNSFGLKKIVASWLR